WQPRNPHSSIQGQLASGPEGVLGEAVVVCATAIDIRWRVGDVCVIGNSQQELCKIVTCVVVIKEKVPVIVRVRRRPDIGQAKPAEVKPKLHGVLSLGPGQVFIDLEIVGEHCVGPRVEDSRYSGSLEGKFGKSSGRERPQL